MCIKYQDTIAQCGVAAMECLVCKKTIVRADESRSFFPEQCVCREQVTAWKTRSTKGRYKQSKRVGRKPKIKRFFHARGRQHLCSALIFYCAEKLMLL